MDPSKSLKENLDNFKVITIGLANTDEKILDENQAIFLLNLKIAIKYGRESLSLEDVLMVLRSRDLEVKNDKKLSFAKGLHVKGKANRRPQVGGRSTSRSQFRSRGNSITLTCWFCKK